MEELRLNKYLSEAGICSRREADRFIEAGKITVDGKIATTGMKISLGQVVVCEGKVISDSKKSHKPCPVLLAVYKPVGVVCTTSDKDRAKNIVEMVNHKERIYPIGRLDKESEGLILMTNQGDLVNKIMRSSNAHEKEYVVGVDKPITQAFLRQMEKGVPILDTITRPCVMEQIEEKTFRIILTQGLNRQIRRMCQYFGYEVKALKRTRIMNISVGKLKPGEYRSIQGKEYHTLLNLIKGSTNLSYKEIDHGKEH